MNESLIFVELLKIMSNKDKEELTESIRTNETDHIKNVIVSFIKKYRHFLVHIL